MRRFEDNTKKDAVLDKVFSLLRGKKQGFLFKVKDENGNPKEVNFVRRGQETVSVIDPVTGYPARIPLERVIVE
jgi:hypothetical protein